MGLKMIPGYTATCDAPGCERDLAEDYSGGEYGAMDKSTIESDFAEADWQRIIVGLGLPALYYCPEHRIKLTDDDDDDDDDEPENADPTPLPPPLFYS